MNLLKKDKYRTKLIQHLLHQQQNHYQEDKENYVNNYNSSQRENEKINENYNEKCYKINESKLLQKVGKSKALICDSEQTERVQCRDREDDLVYNKNKSNKNCKNKQNNNVQNILNEITSINDLKRQKSNLINLSNTKKQKQKQKPSQTSSKKYSTLQPNYQITATLPQPRNHLHKQKYTYHQKLPVMSLSSSNEVNQNILNKLRKNSKQFIVQYKDNKENNQNYVNNSNRKQGNQKKQKKYKFITSNKVLQALEKQKQKKLQLQDNLNQNDDNNQVIEQQKSIKSEQYYEEELKQSKKTGQALNSTKRSKGSKQMMEFLESARQKLFVNMNQAKEQKGQTKHKALPNSQKQPEHSFKIQIQITKDHTCDLQLTFNSNPHQIAKNFILTNRPLLSSFKGLQQNKLQQLLSDRISNEIEKQKNLLTHRKQLQIQEKYKQIINHMGVHEMLLKDDLQEEQLEQNGRETPELKRNSSSDKKVKASTNNARRNILQRNQNLKNKLQNQRNKSKSKTKTKIQQYEHIYIENIDSLPNENKDNPLTQQSPIKRAMKKSSQNFIKQQSRFVVPQTQQHNISESQLFLDNDSKNSVNKVYKNPQLKKLVSFNFKDQNKEFFEKENNLKDGEKNFNLKGYVNSPHQLITYRQNSEDSSCFQSREKEFYKDGNKAQKINEQEFVQHFPLSSSSYDFSKSLYKTKRNQEFKIMEHEINQRELIDMSACQQQIGALKILSKSRQKLKKSAILGLKQKQQNSLEFNQLPLKQQHQEKPQIKQDPQPIQQQKHSLKPQKSTPLTPKMINSMSQLILTRLGGKQTLLASLKQKQIQKRQQIIKENQQKQMQLLKQCSFKPKINNLSKVIDQNKKKKMKLGVLLEKQLKNLVGCGEKQGNQETVEHSNVNQKESNVFKYLQNKNNRYMDLYDNFRTIQAKKQYIRQKSIQQIPFKPQINFISKKIIQTKRNSLNNSVCQEFYQSGCSSSLTRHPSIHSTCKKPNKKRNSMNLSNQNYQSYEQKFMTNHKKRTSLMNFSRNLQGLQIGDYLYKQAMRLKKKKQSMGQTKIQNFKPLNKSEQIMNKMKEKKLKEYFYLLLDIEEDQNNEFNQDQCDLVLQSKDIDLEDEKFTKQPLKFLVPLLQELKELEVCLTLDQFIDSGLKLINYLSVNQKFQFLSKKKDFQQFSQNNSQQVNHPKINEFSKKIVQKKQYYLQDIYHRGLVYKKQIKDKVEINMEDKVRKQLQKCTFKPKVNKGYQTIE